LCGAAEQADFHSALLLFQAKECTVFFLNNTQQARKMRIKKALSCMAEGFSFTVQVAGQR
jgi:hypothetical protein